MLSVAVGALRRRLVGAQEEISLRAVAEELADLALVGELTAQGAATNLGDEGVLVRLDVEGAVRRACARCLEPVVVPLRAECEETFHRVEPPCIVEDRIDLEPMVHEAMVLAEPMRVLCGPDCRGICPGCGKDLNDGPCDCGQDALDPRLWPLRGLLPPREEKR